MAYRIKNWQKFQHYRDRKPEWIKLYRDILEDIEWHELSDRNKGTLVMLWLIASEKQGELPSTKSLSFRLRMKGVDVNRSLSELSHWVEHDDSTLLDGCNQDAMPDKIREEKRREEKERMRAADLLFETFWKQYPKRMAKGPARKAWDVLRPNDELLRNMVEAIEAQKKTDGWTKDNGKFIPHAATWLNQRRWEDEVQEPIEEGSWKDEMMAKISEKSKTN